MNDLHEWFQKMTFAQKISCIFTVTTAKRSFTAWMGKKLRCMLRCTASCLLCRKICF